MSLSTSAALPVTQRIWHQDLQRQILNVKITNQNQNRNQWKSAGFPDTHSLAVERLQKPQIRITRVGSSLHMWTSYHKLAKLHVKWSAITQSLDIIPNFYILSYWSTCRCTLQTHILIGFNVVLLTNPLLLPNLMQHCVLYTENRPLKLRMRLLVLWGKLHSRDLI